ncbi:tetraacyldisaccharide 4'-kinase [Francisella sp. SYW-2]|uniref:tetraacyldisaccharide 4'-kinase n=1 Tax=Francisella sp. SYW-2 TaxID=2610886 RepID=UPI00123E27B8|nr:tetraacyldisaccharide 4'-kinase [Francisella sp. SYW-2]
MIDNIWYKPQLGILSYILSPIAFIFSKIAHNRKIRLQNNQYESKIPVIIVGNISVGGTGKTPVVRMFANQYLEQGKKPVIISRGYGAKAERYPFEVDSKTPASVCGDEPAMLFDALDGKVPIVISPHRVDSVKYIEKNYPDADVIISDDGLQHYKLARTKEVVVIDASRMFGNGLCLPAGPLREPVERLKSVDQIITIGNLDNQNYSELLNYNSNIVRAKIKATKFVNLVTKQSIPIDSFYGKSIDAVAGIGNPDKFFSSLDELGVNIYHEHIFRDHHKYTPKDFEHFDPEQIVIMTYKDAIKCKDFAKSNWWYLDIALEPY